MSANEYGNWWNYVKGDYDWRKAPETDEEAVQYMPQQRDVICIYRCRRMLGDSVLEAMVYALESATGTKHIVEKGE